MHLLKQQWPPSVVAVLLSGALFVAGSLILGASIYAANDGHIVYTTDDAYVHLAIAKNLSKHGVFGVTRYEFSSATSSPLWTLLIAASFMIVGVSEWVPAFWCVTFGVLSLAAVALFCRHYRIGSVGTTIACVLVLYLTPLLALASTGLEHCLHTALTLMFLLFSARVLDEGSRGATLGASAAAALATATRYESFFYILPVLGIFLLNHRRSTCLLVIGAASLSPLAYGFCSLLHGSFFLPNSLMLKGHFPEVHGLKSPLDAAGLHGFRRLMMEPHLISLCLVVLIGGLLGRRARLPTSLRLFPLVFFVWSVLHMHLAGGHRFPSF